jgi:hypothetical protein
VDGLTSAGLVSPGVFEVVAGMGREVADEVLAVPAVRLGRVFAAGR